jgi:hypothetical protein
VRIDNEPIAEKLIGRAIHDRAFSVARDPPAAITRERASCTPGQCNFFG